MRSLKRLKDKPIKSLSLDNGSEFAEFRELEEQLKGVNPKFCVNSK